jgi:hypothetical protein
MLPLLRALGRGELRDDEYEHVGRLLAAEPTARDPQAFVAALGTTGYVPLAYRHLIGRARFPVEPALAAALSAEFRRHTLSRFRMTVRLRELLTALRAHGIDALPFKGPALAIQLYGNFAMRQFGDLDILVPPRQAGAALEVLKALGLRPAAGYPGNWEAFIRAERHHDFSLRDRETGTLVELHWSLAAPLDGVDVNMSWFLQQRETIDLLGATTQVLGPERLVLALSIHGARHIWARLSWVGELAEIIRRSPGIDWEIVRAEASRAGFTAPFAASVLLAHEWFDAPRPAWLGDDPSVRRLAEIARRPLSTVERDDGRLSDRLQWTWHAAPTGTERIRRLWRIVTIPSEKDVSTTLRSPWRSRFYVVARAGRLLRTALSDWIANPRR